jgi:hypothetical protein
MPAPDLVESIRKGECILFLGAMASAPTPEGCKYNYKASPPSGTEMARRLAEKCAYPYEDTNNLQRVALYFERRDAPGRGSRQALISAIKEELDKPEIEPSPALHMLAALPFRMIITTNYDNLFDIALSRANTRDGRPKSPQLRVYDPLRSGPPESVPLDPLERQPVLLKLHGDLGHPESIVITEEDYIVFIQRMSTQHLHPIHEFIRTRMKTWPVLFVGYSLKDYNLRLLFRTLRWNVDPAGFPICFSVDPHPDGLIVSVWQSGDRPIVSFIREDLWSFVPTLYKECMGVEYSRQRSS